MKKADYIEKYGEDAYLSYRKKRNEYNKEWSKNNPEKVKTYNRTYYVKNAETICDKCKNWRDNNKDYVRERDKKYRKRNPRTEYFKQYRIDNKEYLITKNNNYHKQTKSGRAVSLINTYNQADKKRGFDISNNLTTKWMVENIFSGQKCVYCGDSDWRHLGCDRIDNTKPHTPDNIVCACGICNFERNDNYSVEEFKEYRKLHPRACDIPKATVIQLSETGAIKKRTIN